MILLAILAAIGSSAGADMGNAADRLRQCVITKADAFEPAKEATDTTVQAALDACLPERADFRVALQESLKADGKLTSAQASRVEQSSYDLVISGARGTTLVRLIEKRAANAQNH